MENTEGPMMLSAFFAAFYLLCSVLCDFENTFRNYSAYSLPERFNPIYGALLIENNFLLNSYLYGDIDKSFVKCVKFLFQITDPNSTGVSDFKVKNEFKEMKLSQVLNYLSGLSAQSHFLPLQKNCGDDEIDSILLWAAFYLSRKRQINESDFVSIQSKVDRMNAVQLEQSILNDVIYLVKTHRGTPDTQIQSTQVLIGTNANFFNCVESTVLDMINFGIFSNPSLFHEVNLERLTPHWSKHANFRKGFFSSIKQPHLISVTEEQLKEVYSNIFKEIHLNRNVKENWAKVSQDFPSISYGNFYIAESKTICKRSFTSEIEYVKVHRKVYDSFEGEIKNIPHPIEACSNIPFKHLKDTNIYLTFDDGIILYEIHSLLRNFEGIIRYFFGLDFNSFRINQSDKESFDNLSNIFKSKFNFTISSSSHSENVSTFYFTFKNRCSGQLTVKKYAHSFTSNFLCAPAEQFLQKFRELWLNSKLKPIMKQCIEFFNLENIASDENSIQVFKNKNYDRFFYSSFIDMQRVFHFAEKSQTNFELFYNAILNDYRQILTPSDEDKIVYKTKMESFLKSFVLGMEANERFQISLFVLKVLDLVTLKFFVEKISDFNPSDNDNLALHTAIKSDNTEVVEYFISLKEKFPTFDPPSAFQIAIRNGCLEAVEYFINSKYFQEINAVDLGNKSLINAVSNGHLLIVQYLISNKEIFPKINPAAENNQALVCAASNGHLEILIYLISLKRYFPDINLSDQNNAAFISAAKNGALEVVKYITTEHLDQITGGDAIREAFVAVKHERSHSHILEYFLLQKNLFPYISDCFDHALFDILVQDGRIDVIRMYIAKLGELPENQIIDILRNLMKIAASLNWLKKFKQAFFLQKEFPKIDFTNANFEVFEVVVFNESFKVVQFLIEEFKKEKVFIIDMLMRLCDSDNVIDSFKGYFIDVIDQLELDLLPA